MPRYSPAINKPLTPSTTPPSPQDGALLAPGVASTGGSRHWGLLLLLGSVLGFGALGLEHAPAPLSILSAWGGAWLMVGFLAGLLTRRPLLGGVAGVVTLVLATAVYYGAKAAFGSPLNPLEYDEPAFWFIAAVVAGGLHGVGGGVWASWGRWARVAAVAVLAGTVLWEALWQIRGDSIWVLIFGVAGAIPLVFLRGYVDRIVGLALTLPVAGSLWLLTDRVLPVLFRLA